MPALWFGLFCLIPLGAAIANRTPIPAAVIWSLLGFAVAFVPGFPAVWLDPRIALFLILPPLVYASAVLLPWPAFRDNLRPIAMLAIGLVAASTVAVAALAHAMAGFPWAVAFVLGAIASPTDPVAASSVAPRIGLPLKLAAILEGEGLVNDAVALSIFRIALAAAAGGGFSPGAGLLRFAAILVAEPLYGWALGVAVAFIRARISDPLIEITVSLLTPFAAYLLPQRLGGSGILATVAVGMYIGERYPTLVPAGTRIHAMSFWRMIVFLLNALLFVAAGIELRMIMRSGYTARVLGCGLLIGAAVAVLRIAWCVLFFYGVPALRRRPGAISARGLTVIAWAGMRGPVSLAAALSIPASAGSARVPDFQLIVFITAVVIMTTLLVQGTALPWLIRLLGLSRDADAERRQLHREQRVGERMAADAALNRLAELEAQGRVPRETAERLRRLYQDRLDDAAPQSIAGGGDSLDPDVRSELIGAERSRILQLRNEGRIGDHALERLQRGLDLREILLD